MSELFLVNLSGTKVGFIMNLNFFDHIQTVDSSLYELKGFFFLGGEVPLVTVTLRELQKNLPRKSLDFCYKKGEK